MTTATRKESPASCLAEYQRRSDLWEKAEQIVRDLSRQLADKLARSRELHNQRRRLIHQQPELVNHLLQPVDKDNPIGAIDRELEKIGDLGEFQAKIDHEKRLAQSAKQATAGYLAAHFEAVIEGRRPDAEQVAADANEAVKDAHAKTVGYLDFVRWAEGVSVLAGRNPRSVPGLDASAELLRRLEGWDLPTPLPEVG